MVGVQTSSNKLRTSLNGFGRIGNEVELVRNGFKLTTDGLGLLGNGKFTRSELDMN